LHRRNIQIALLASALMASFGTLTAGCGDACEEASAKIDECLGGDGDGYQGSEPECSGEIACSAECTVEASCEDIYEFFRELPDVAGLTGTNPYAQCMSTCAEE
jgi:hypothetical protein